MKNIVAILLTFLVFSSCSKLDELNVNIKDPSSVPGESLFTGAQLRLGTVIATPNVNRNIFRMFVQQWTETTYIDEANYDIVTRPIPGNFWDILYRDVLMNLKESGKVLTETGNLPGQGPAVLQNKLATVEVLTVYSYAVLVETFGNVPYTEALNADILLPKYDDGLTIYKDLIVRLNDAIGKMDQAAAGMGSSDNMFHGDMAMWYKFANSLKLRMGMVLAEADAALATTTVNEAVAAGVIASNADNALMAFMSTQPNNNPVNDNLVRSGRNDFVAANTMVDAMLAVNDPRLAYFFTMVGDPPAYVGGLYGESNDYSQFSHVNPTLTESTYPVAFFDYAETELLLAEAVERGFLSGSAEAHYNAAIRASIDFYGGTTAEADAYLAEAGVAYATAPGDWKQKIGMQKWFALYNRGFEAWTAWRILNYPVLVPPPDAESVVPLRLTYPVAEQTLNGANRAAAASDIGGDDVGTRLFFDMN